MSENLGPSVAQRGGINWPRKQNLFGVFVSATNYDEAVNLIIRAAKQGLAATVAWYLSRRDWCEAVQSGSYQRERLGLTR